MLKKILGFSMATWIGALLTFILIPVASHLYTSHDLGVINYYYSIINIVFTFITIGLDQAYLRFYYDVDEVEKKKLFTANIIITVLVIVSINIVGAFFYKEISIWMVDCIVPVLPVIIAMHLTGLTITRYFVILFRLKSRLIPYTIYSVLNTILLKSVYIIAYPISPDSLTGIYTTAIVSILISLALLFSYRSEMDGRELYKERNTVVSEIKYAFPLIPAMVFAVINNYIPQIALRSMTDFSNVALYSIAVTMASTITLLHNGLNTYLEPYIFNNYNQKRQEISAILDVFTKCSIIVCMIIIVLQNLFFIVFDKQYFESTQFLPILLCSSLWYAIGDFYNIGVKINKRTSENIKVYCAGFIVNLILSNLLIPHMGCFGAAVSAASASAVISFCKVLIGNKHYKIMQTYRNVLLGSFLLLVIATINYSLWDNSIKYLIEISITVGYIIISGLINDIKGYISNHHSSY